MNSAAIVLAAGAGKRMKSKKPKVAHEVLGKPMVRWVIDAARAAGIERVVSVVGHAREQVIPLVETDTSICVQPERDGTGGAVRVCAEEFKNFDGSLVVLSGDCPLITPETIQALIKKRKESNAAVVVLTMTPPDPHGYGRIVRDAAGNVSRIVEEADATPEEREITECNSGFYCFSARALFEALEQLNSNNAQGECYLTDVLEICVAAGMGVCALPAASAAECLGVNSRAQLAAATKILQRRINNAHMSAGVSMTDPDQVWIGPDVQIEQDVELLPQTMLFGNTRVGEDSVIGPNTRLTNTAVGRGCVVCETVAIDAVLEDGADAGPRAYLRPGAHLMHGAHVGTHVEVKKSVIGAGAKVPHLSYIGDAKIGAGVNIGAGSITCNYDGKNKNPTHIGEGAFIGSDTMMVAPVNIGAGAVVGAGSCITRDVPDYALALTRPDLVVKEDWAKKHM